MHQRGKLQRKACQPWAKARLRRALPWVRALVESAQRPRTLQPMGPHCNTSPCAPEGHGSPAGRLRAIEVRACSAAPGSLREPVSATRQTRTTAYGYLVSCCKRLAYGPVAGPRASPAAVDSGGHDRGSSNTSVAPPTRDVLWSASNWEPSRGSLAAIGLRAQGRPRPAEDTGLRWPALRPSFRRACMAYLGPPCASRRRLPEGMQYVRGRGRSVLLACPADPRLRGEPLRGHGIRRTLPCVC